MSRIENYQCSNENCTFRMQFMMHFPIWKDDCPENRRKVPVSISTVQYVQAYESDYFCLKCGLFQRIREELVPPEKEKTVFEKFLMLFKKPKPPAVRMKPEAVCAHCKTSEHLLTDDALCPKCKVGTFTAEYGRTVKF